MADESKVSLSSVFGVISLNFSSISIWLYAGSRSIFEKKEEVIFANS